MYDRDLNYIASPIDEYDEVREERRHDMYHIHKCLRALHPDDDLLDDVENKSYRPYPLQQFRFKQNTFDICKKSVQTR